jgi:hypothetical protein
MCFIKFAGKDEQLVVKADKLDVVDGFETSSSKVVAFLDGKIVAIAPMIHVEYAYLDIV